MSVGENRAFIEVTPRGPAKSTFQNSSTPGEWSHSCVPCTRTVPKHIELEMLGLALSEKQIPQIVENHESGTERIEPLEGCLDLRSYVHTYGPEGTSDWCLPHRQRLAIRVDPSYRDDVKLELGTVEVESPWMTWKRRRSGSLIEASVQKNDKPRSSLNGTPEHNWLFIGGYSGQLHYLMHCHTSPVLPMFSGLHVSPVKLDMGKDM